MKHATYIGLAIHPERLSMIKLKQIKKQISIEGFASTVHQNGLDQALKQLIKENKVKQGRAALALSASHVIQKRIKVPAYLNEAERAAEISLNLKHYLPGMDEPLYFDFFAIEKNEREVELQLIAARIEQVDTYIQLAKTVGL